jgi:hypothetical protein
MKAFKLSAPLRRRLDTFLLALLVCACPVHTALADVCSVPTFQPARTFTTGTNSVFVTSGDFNGDGKPDLAVAYTDGGISVLLGNGDGTFRAAMNQAVGQSPTFMAVGDFNGDGKPDLAVANYFNPNGSTSTNGSVSVLLGNGDGTFRSALSYSVGTNPVFVAVGDFDGNGKPDLVVANEGSWDGGNYVNSSISVLLGRGDGTFQHAASPGAGVGVSSVAVGDFNGDGKLDLAVSNLGGYDPNVGPQYINGGVSVLLGNGDGTFQKAVNYKAGVQSVGVVVGDFNGDGTRDLAVANLETVFNDFVGGVSVLLGNGDGTFRPVVDLALGRLAAIGVADFNSDGIPDLVVNGEATLAAGPIPTTLLLGNGDGTFRAFQTDTLMNFPEPLIFGPAFTVGDFNGDGKPDVAVASGANISVFVNAGTTSPSPTFAEIAEFPAGFNSSSVVVGDLNGDGKPDLVANDSENNSGNVVVLLGNGDGIFQRGIVSDAGVPTDSLATGDFNGDGKLDVAAGNQGSISILLGKGDGTFQAAVKFATPSARFAVGDFNNDGKSDLAIANYTNSSVSVLLGNGDGTFQAAVEYGAGSGTDSVAVGDFNGDGKPDLAIYNYANSSVSVLLGNGDGTFRSGAQYIAGPNAALFAMADFNEDGKLDLAVCNLGVYDDTTGTYTNSSVSVLLGNGDGTFQAALTTYTTFGFPYNLWLKQVAVGDVNDDGKPDLLAIGPGISVLLGNGDGTFQPAPAFSYYARNAYSVAVADFNGDGRLDFVTIRGTDFFDVTDVWLNTSCSARPSLAIARSSADLTVSWPFPSAGYVLESSTSLSPASWKPAGVVPVNNNGRWEVTTPTTQSESYFRLRKP